MLKNQRIREKAEDAKEETGGQTATTETSQMNLQKKRPIQWLKYRLFEQQMTLAKQQIQSNNLQGALGSLEKI